MGNCIICGTETNLYYAGNKNFPLCTLPSCEVAFENEMNVALQGANEGEEDEELQGYS